MQSMRATNSLSALMENSLHDASAQLNDDLDATNAEIRSIANLPDYMQATASTPNGAMLIGGGEDSLLRVWDAIGKVTLSRGINFKARNACNLCGV